MKLAAIAVCLGLNASVQVVIPADRRASSQVAQRISTLEDELRRSKRREEKLAALQYRLREDLKQNGGSIGYTSPTTKSVKVVRNILGPCTSAAESWFHSLDGHTFPHSQYTSRDLCCRTQPCFSTVQHPAMLELWVSACR